MLILVLTCTLEFYILKIFYFYLIMIIIVNFLKQNFTRFSYIYLYNETKCIKIIAYNIIINYELITAFQLYYFLNIN